MVGKMGGYNVADVFSDDEVNDLLTLSERRLFANSVYFSNDVSRDEDGTGQNDRGEGHVGVVLEDVGETADGDFDGAESKSDS